MRREVGPPGLPGRGRLIRQETLGSGHILLLLVTAAPRGRKTLSSRRSSTLAAPPACLRPPPPQPPAKGEAERPVCGLLPWELGPLPASQPLCRPGLPAAFLCSPDTARGRQGWQKHDRGPLAPRDVQVGSSGLSVPTSGPQKPPLGPWTAWDPRSAPPSLTPWASTRRDHLGIRKHKKKPYGRHRAPASPPSAFPQPLPTT